MYYRQEFDGSQLAMLFQAFNKNLFTRPQKYDILSKSHGGDSGCSFFFKEEYLTQLINDMVSARDKGNFANSNADAEWNVLLALVSNASQAKIHEYEGCSDYYSQCSMFW